MAILLWLMNRNWVPLDIILDQLGVTLGVGVVQRCVHLVEQAERRRVELEDRKHQRNRGQRLLAARQQVDGAVLLARRLRHHLHAGPGSRRRSSPGWHCRRRTGWGTSAEVLVDLVEGGPASRSRVSMSILRIASSSVVMASRQVGVLRVQEGLRSRALVSSSSAARLTAPSAAISRLMRSISVCRPQSLTPPSSIVLRQRFQVDPGGVSCSRYCAPPSCAACSSSCSLVICSRSGSRLRSKPSAARRPARSLALRSSYSLRVAASACSRSSFSASASAGRPARRRR
jgi:hypothetical protein